jgi:hypothetical protein
MHADAIKRHCIALSSVILFILTACTSASYVERKAGEGDYKSVIMVYYNIGAHRNTPQEYYGERPDQVLDRSENIIIEKQIQCKPVILAMMKSEMRDERYAALRAASLVFDREYMEHAKRMLDDNDAYVRQMAVYYFRPVSMKAAHYRNFSPELKREIIDLLLRRVETTTDYTMLDALLNVLQSFDDAIVSFALRDIQKSFTSFSKKIVNVQLSRPINANEKKYLKDLLDDVINKSGKIH